MATVTLPPNAVAVFPSASCAVTCTAGVIAAPAMVVVGGTVNASRVAAPGVTLKAALVWVSPAAPAVKVYALPTLLMLNPGNAATPLTAATVVRSEEHTSELQSRLHLVCRLLLEKKKQQL